jgi:hypothetical protein
VSQPAESASNAAATLTVGVAPAEIRVVAHRLHAPIPAGFDHAVAVFALLHITVHRYNRYRLLVALYGTCADLCEERRTHRSAFHFGYLKLVHSVWHVTSGTQKRAEFGLVLRQVRALPKIHCVRV